MEKFVLTMSVLFVVCSTPAFGNMANPPSWDMVNLDFGSDPGKTTVVANFDVNPGMGNVGITESLTPDLSRLDVPGGPSWYIAESKPGVVVPGSANYTYEIKIGIANPNAWYIFQARNAASLGWQLRISGGALYLCDPWGSTFGADLKPAGFDFAQQHIYRVVTKDNVATLYLDNNPVRGGICYLTNTYGITELVIGMQSGSPGDTLDIDYIRAAGGAWGTELLTPPKLGHDKFGFW